VVERPGKETERVARSLAVGLVTKTLKAGQPINRVTLAAELHQLLSRTGRNLSRQEVAVLVGSVLAAESPLAAR